MTIRTINNRSLRTMYLIILVQFIVIAFLLAIISNEYLSNYWMQVWISGKAPMLAFLINGQLDSLLIGVAAAGTLLFVNGAIAQTKTQLETKKPTIIMDIRELERIEKKVLHNPSKPFESSPEDLLRDLERQEA
ncbi:hypothetical protein E6H23_04420 [Candidatus Bathyarchaeota archaeon]|nr:MAG: hypothetical protein E6H23_04420 [Candidatus Bathyarchaeota archaeon]